MLAFALTALLPCAAATFIGCFSQIPPGPNPPTYDEGDCSVRVQWLIMADQLTESLPHWLRRLHLFFHSTWLDVQRAGMSML